MPRATPKPHRKPPPPTAPPFSLEHTPDAATDQPGPLPSIPTIPLPIRESHVFLSPTLGRELLGWSDTLQARFLAMAKKLAKRGYSRADAARWSMLATRDDPAAEHEPPHDVTGAPGRAAEPEPRLNRPIPGDTTRASHGHSATPAPRRRR